MSSLSSEVFLFSQIGFARQTLAILSKFSLFASTFAQESDHLFLNLKIQRNLVKGRLLL